MIFFLLTTLLCLALVWIGYREMSPKEEPPTTIGGVLILETKLNSMVPMPTMSMLADRAGAAPNIHHYALLVPPGGLDMIARSRGGYSG